ncbi:MAG: YciI family protein [Sphingomonadales bacterium]
MIFAIVYQFKKNCATDRAEARDDHIIHVKGAGGKLKVAGPLAISETDDGPWGSLIIIKADSFTTAQLFAKNDPYVKCGIVENTLIQPWAPAIGEWVD